VMIGAKTYCGIGKQDSLQRASFDKENVNLLAPID